MPRHGDISRHDGLGRIVMLYEALGRLAPSPVVDLNRAVAVAMADGPAAALPIVDESPAAAALPGSHLLSSVRGELLSLLGRGSPGPGRLDRLGCLGGPGARSCWSSSTGSPSGPVRAGKRMVS